MTLSLRLAGLPDAGQKVPAYAASVLAIARAVEVVFFSQDPGYLEAHRDTDDQDVPG
jgi:hypothetical protein